MRNNISSTRSPATAFSNRQSPATLARSCEKTGTWTRSSAAADKDTKNEKSGTAIGKAVPTAAKDKTLNFRANWNVAPAMYTDPTEVLLHSHLTPNAEAIRDIFHEAVNFGHFRLDPQVPQAPHVEQVPPVPHHAIAMMQAGLMNNGPITTIREGSHQIEMLPNGGFQMHLGTLFNGVNYHVNLQQNPAGSPHATSISWGLPGTAAHGALRRTMPVQSIYR